MGTPGGYCVDGYYFISEYKALRIISRQLHACHCGIMQGSEVENFNSLLERIDDDLTAK
jgi:hypothetical protein